MGFAIGIAVLVRTLTLAIEALGPPGPPDAAAPTRLSNPQACFHLALLLALCIHNFTESNLEV